jgi:trans-aconitate methyltransferase
MTQTWNAGLYDAKHAFVWEKAQGLLELLAAQPGERILDLGCGTGALSAEIASSGADVVGLDRSVDMIEEARRKFPRLRFEVADACSLPFVAEFDAVFSNAVLHWIPQAGAVARGIARALRPNGRLVAEFGGKGNVAELVGALESALGKFSSSPCGPHPWYYPSLAEYAAVLEENGLEVRQAALFRRPTQLADGQAGLANWITMFCGTFLEKIPEKQRADFVGEVEKAARARLWKEDHWELDYRRLRVAAWKAAV